MTHAPTTEHAPKTAALLAYAEGLLSRDGTRRVDVHLARCATCRRELAAIRLYDRMVDDVRDAEAPEVDFDRMELVLAREAKRVTEQRARRDRVQRWAPWLGVAAAAAAILALLFSEPVPPPVATRPERPAYQPPAPSAPIALAEPTVTLVTGNAERGLDGHASDGAFEALEVGDVLTVEQVLRTGDDGRVHVAVTGETGFAMAPGTELALTDTAEDDFRLTLHRGEVAHAVAPLENGSRYVILAGGYEIEVAGTRFVVAYVDDVLAVDVTEGVVVVRRDGEEVRLEAPASWSSDGAEARMSAATRVRGVDVPAGDATVELAHPELVRWEVDGTLVESATPVRMGIRTGLHRVRGWTVSGRLYEGEIDARSGMGALDEGAMVSEEAPRIESGYLEPREITPVVQRGQRSLSRCYEMALRRGNVTVPGRVRLRLGLAVDGSVRRVTVRGVDGDVPESMDTCIQNYVGRWTFPPPGGPLSLDLPLRLAPTQ